MKIVTWNIGGIKNFKAAINTMVHGDMAVGMIQEHNIREGDARIHAYKQYAYNQGYRVIWAFSKQSNGGCATIIRLSLDYNTVAKHSETRFSFVWVALPELDLSVGNNYISPTN